MVGAVLVAAGVLVLTIQAPVGASASRARRTSVRGRCATGRRLGRYTMTLVARVCPTYTT